MFEELSPISPTGLPVLSRVSKMATCYVQKNLSALKKLPRVALNNIRDIPEAFITVRMILPHVGNIILMISILTTVLFLLWNDFACPCVCVLWAVWDSKFK